MQRKLQDIREVRLEMPWMVDYITDSGLPAVLCSAFDGAKASRPSSLHGFCDEGSVSPAVAPIDT